MVILAVERPRSYGTASLIDKWFLLNSGIRIN